MGSCRQDADHLRPISLSGMMMGAGGAIQAVFVLILQPAFAEPNFRVSKCVSTIVSCCNPGQPAGQHPLGALRSTSVLVSTGRGKTPALGALSPGRSPLSAMWRPELRMSMILGLKLKLSINL